MSRSNKGFSLLELLVVIAILGILLVISTISLRSIRSGQNIRQAGGSLVDQLATARQSALSHNTRVRCVILSTGDDRTGEPAAFRRMHIEIFDPAARRWKQDSRGVFLPVGVVVDPSRSPMLTNASPGSSNSITFLPSGRTDLNPNGKRSAVLTLADLKNTNNFISVQLDPVSGRCRTFQP